jgi:hypothetical protein
MFMRRWVLHITGTLDPVRGLTRLNSLYLRANSISGMSVVSVLSLVLLLWRSCEYYHHRMHVCLLRDTQFFSLSFPGKTCDDRIRRHTGTYARYDGAP